MKWLWWPVLPQGSMRLPALSVFLIAPEWCWESLSFLPWGTSGSPSVSVAPMCNSWKP